MLLVRNLLVLLTFCIADETQTNGCLECTSVLSSYTVGFNFSDCCLPCDGALLKKSWMTFVEKDSFIMHFFVNIKFPRSYSHGIISQIINVSG